MLTLGELVDLHRDTYHLLVYGSRLQDTRTIELYAYVLRWVAGEVVVEQALAADLALGERHYAAGSALVDYGE